MKKVHRSLLWCVYGIPFILLVIVSTARAQEDDGPTPTPKYVHGDVTRVIDPATQTPTETTVPTETAVPTNTPPPTLVPTETAAATATLSLTQTPVPTETAVATATPLPTEPATATPTVDLDPTATPDYGPDFYEPDSLAQPAVWTGTMYRTFSPADDVDYVRYYVKSGQTEIWTTGLTGAADTQIEVYHDGVLLAQDDDSGEGLGSYLNFKSEREMEIVIVIHNKAVGFGPEVEYTLEIVPQANFTPTPTRDATATPTAVLPTQTPVIVTATPEPTNTPTLVPVYQGPLPTATPSMEFVLRVDVYIDADRDGELDSGEGVDGIYIEARTLDTSVSFTGYTVNGIAIIEVICPPGSHSSFNRLEVVAPYLQTSKYLDIYGDEETLVTNFALQALVLPIALP